jgi:hypothetical protein
MLLIEIINNQENLLIGLLNFFEESYLMGFRYKIGGKTQLIAKENGK